MASRAELQRRSALRRGARRNRLIVVGALVVSAIVVAAWFPASGILQGRAQLDAAAAALHSVDHQNAALRHAASELDGTGAVGRIARDQYDLVAPGEAAYQVLPPSAQEAAAGPIARHSVQSSVTGAGANGDGGFASRVLQTLEFWR